MKALLVEDNAADVGLIRLALQEADPSVDLYVADDGVKALEFLKRQGRSSAVPIPDFVLLDLRLPRKSGLEVLSEIKRDPRLRRIPVIVLSSSRAMGDIIRAYELQAAAYFAKPVTGLGDVVAVIVRFLGTAELPGDAPGAGSAGWPLDGQPTVLYPPLPVASEQFEDMPRDRQLAALVDSSMDPVIGASLDGTIITWNRSAEELYGHTEQEARGQNVRLIVTDEGAGDVAAALEAAKRGEPARIFDTVRLDRDGHKIAVSSSASPIRDRHGNVVGVSLMSRDITERKLVEDRFRLAVESSPNAVVTVDAQGRIVLVNGETERMFGYNRDELIGRSVDLLVPERFRAAHPDHRKAFMRHPETRAMGGGRDLYGLRRDGTEFPVEIGLRPIETPDGAMVMSAIVDITERKQAEERFRLAVESSPSGMVMVDSQGRIVLVNAEAERLFGYKRDELLGQSTELLFPERFRNLLPHLRPTFQALPEARPMGAGLELYGLRKNGTEFPIEIGLNPIKTSSGAFVLSAIVDITERKRTENELVQQTRELARSNSELAQFAYVASHDLQEPLRTVASYTELLEHRYGDRLDEDARTYIKFARDGAVRMQRLLEALLAYSRVGTRTREPISTDAGRALDHALDALKAAIDEAGAKIVRGKLPAVMADPTQLAEMFQNLVGNGVKFRGKIAPVVEIGARRRDSAWVFSVRDNGIGIESVDFDRIFQVFQRLHTREEYPGTGIGLAICRRIAERMGGTVWVESEPGKGSTFFFDVPDRAPEQSGAS